MMNVRDGLEILSNTSILDEVYVRAIQQVGESCWKYREELVNWDIAHATPPMLFVYISGGVLQVDIDRCYARCSITTRSSTKLFHDLLGISTDILNICRVAYDRFYADILGPAACRLYGPYETIHRQPGRKLLLSGHPGQPQLLHLDSLWPTLVGNIYLRPRGFEHVPIRATRIVRETPSPYHPRDLRVNNADDALGAGTMAWDAREPVGPSHVQHNTSILFCGNIIHGGPGPDELAVVAEPRMVMFQMVRPGSSPADDLSDFQEFEFSLYMRKYGPGAETRRVVEASCGRWKDHFTICDDQMNQYEQCIQLA